MFLAPLLLLVLGGARGGALAAVLAPSWADPRHNPCAAQPGGWQLLLWPADGRCYRIFRRGHPCPASMELSPGVGRNGAPGCRCPPATAQLHPAHQLHHLQHLDANMCHPLLEQGPCPAGQYFAPLPPAPSSEDRVPSLWGACRDPEPCPPGHVFWPRDGRCYPRLTRGPCYRGELLVAVKGSPSGSPSAPLGACRCEPRGQLGRYFSPLTKTCHEHYTPGPCQERGHLFLPGGQCGCSPDLPHYHPASDQCYQTDTIGPCPAGHRFTVAVGGVVEGEAAPGPPGPAGRAQCRCKAGHVRWSDGACYRPWTRGPCGAGHLLSNASECVTAPCRPGRLYFPEEMGCFKVGVRGPCPKGQVVLFESAVRPALEGISHRGMCGCTGPTARSSSNDITGKAVEDNRCSSGVDFPSKDVDATKRISTNDNAHVAECEARAGGVPYNGSCHTLYSQGPCPLGQWLVPQRRGRGGGGGGGGGGGAGGGAGGGGGVTLWSDSRPRPRARCDCRPGHKPAGNATVLECQPPTVVLATFLNARGFAGS